MNAPRRGARPYESDGSRYVPYIRQRERDLACAVKAGRVDCTELGNEGHYRLFAPGNVGGRSIDYWPQTGRFVITLYPNAIVTTLAEAIAYLAKHQ